MKQKENQFNSMFTATVEPFFPQPPSLNIWINAMKQCMYPTKKIAHGTRLQSPSSGNC